MDMADNESFERPLECGECKKPIAVLYTEIVGNTITRTVMCNDCPVLKRRLFGELHPLPYVTIPEGGTGLACGSCGTTLDAIRMGSPLGCSQCYEIFEEVVLAELQQAQKLPSHINILKKSSPVHIGKAPGERQEINPSARLLALNEALSETLKREDYEQAAWLRDQIKALTEEQQEEKDKEDKDGERK
jgi:protein arginine kinase activator